MSATFLITSGIAALGVAIYFFLTSKFNYWKKKGIVGPQPTFFYGTIKDLALRKNTLHHAYGENYKNFPNEKYVGLFRYRNPVLLIRDLDIIKHIMVKDFDHFVDRGIEFSEKGLGLNIFHAEADKWRILRSKFTPTFTSGKLKGMLHLLNNSGDKFIEYLSKHVEKVPEDNVYNYVKKFTKSGISSCAFGIDLDINNTEMFQKLQKIDDMVLYNNYINDLDWMFPGIMKKLNMDLFPSVVSDFFRNLVNDISGQRKGVPSNRNDFMDLIIVISKNDSLIGANRNDKEKTDIVRIDEQVMAAQAFVFYVGGFETSASTVTFMLHELAFNLDVQERLVTEINEVIERHGKLTYEAVQEMTYLTQVFDETLRKYPILDPLVRAVKKDYKIPNSDVVLEKGTTVLVSVQGIHYDEKIYPDPMKFDPDRFTPENIKNRHAAAYLPFGIGPRNCIGMRFGQLQSKLCLIKLLPKFRVEPASNSTYNLTYDPNNLALASLNGVPLKTVPRDY